MSSVFGSRLARHAARRMTSATQRPTMQSSVSGVRHMAEYTGPWPGPNPLKDVFYGLSLGLVLAIAFKSWQIKDKADRVHFYQEYERAVRVEEARKEKERKEKEAAGETEEESEEEPAEEE